MRASRIICCCLVVGAVRAEAGKWAPQCSQAAESSAQQCQAAFDGYKAADAAASAAGKAASGTNINSNSGVSSNTTSGLSQKAAAAKSQCEAAKKQCESQCDSAKAGADGDASNPNPAISNPAKADQQQIPQDKANKCQKPIDKNIQGLEQAKSDLDRATKEANDTKKESEKGGGAPQGSPPQGGDKSSDNGTSAGGTAQAKLNCAVAGGSRFSDCNATFTSKCTASMSANECDQFTNRFCNVTSTDPSSGVPLGTATTNLVIDQKGEGVGSNYCAYASSYRFCQTSGREQCASCQRIYVQQTCGDSTQCLAQSSDSEQAKQKAACPDDPIYVTGGWTMGGAAASGSGVGAAAGSTFGGSTLLSTTGSASNAQLNASLTGSSSSSALALTPASAGGGGSGFGAGGGGGSFGGGVGTAVSGETPSSGSSNREGLPNGIIPSNSSDGGGAAGGSGNEPSWISESERAPAADLRKAFEGRKPDAAAPMAGMPPDVSNSLGTSIFSIGSGGIHSFCLKNQVGACGR